MIGSSTRKYRQGNLRCSLSYKFVNPIKFTADKFIKIVLSSRPLDNIKLNNIINSGVWQTYDYYGNNLETEINFDTNTKLVYDNKKLVERQIFDENKNIIKITSFIKGRGNIPPMKGQKLIIPRCEL